MNQHDSTNPRTWKGGFGLKRKLTSIVGAMLATATLLGGMVLPAQASMVDSVTTDPDAGIMPVASCADSGVTSPVTSISVAAIDFWKGQTWQDARSAPIPASYSSPSVNSQNNVIISMFCNNSRFAINRGGDDWRGNGSANLYFTLNDDYWIVLAAGDKSNSMPEDRPPYPPLGTTGKFKATKGTSCFATLLFDTKPSEQSGNADDIRRQATVSCGGTSINSDNYGHNVAGVGLFFVKDNPGDNVQNVTLTYNGNGGTGSVPSQTVPQDSFLTVSQNGFSKSNAGGQCTFQAWNTSSSGTGTTYRPGQTMNIQSNTTLYAIWDCPAETTYDYRLHYDANGGSGAPADWETSNTTGGTMNATVSAQKPTRNGYTFLGWSTSSTATNATYQAGSTVRVSADQPVTLYAVWQQKEANAGLVFNGNGGSGAPAAQSAAGQPGGTHTFTIPNGKPTWAKHVFKGWAENRQATTADHQPGDTVNVAYGNTTTLYAVWEENANANLQYDANGGQGAPQGESATGTTGAKQFTVSNQQPTWTGHKFLGWATDSNATTPTYQAGDKVSVNYGDTITLYAVWQENKDAVVHFDPNGGTGAPGDLSETGTTGNKEFTIPAQTPTWEGHKFLGWAEDPKATKPTVQPGGKVTVNYGDTKTLYAVWVENMDATLNYDANGGQDAPQAESATGTPGASKEFTVSNTQPTRAGHKFLGWAEDPKATTPTVQAGAKITVNYGDTTTLYAVWQADQPATVKFDANGGQNAPNALTANGQPGDAKEFTIPAQTPTWAGHKFLGWAEDPKATTATTQPSSKLSVDYGKTVTLYAVWSADKDAVIQYDPNGGENAPKGETAAGQPGGGKEFTIPAQKPTYTGRVFLGWAEDPKATTPSKQPGDKVTVNFGDTKTWYAVWQNTPPTIDGTDDKQITVGDKFDPMENVTGTDREDGDVTGKITVTGTVDPSKPGKYELTYTVTDKAGNTTTEHRVVTVVPKVLAKMPQTGTTMGVLIGVAIVLIAGASITMTLVSRKRRHSVE